MHSELWKIPPISCSLASNNLYRYGSSKNLAKFSKDSEKYLRKPSFLGSFSQKEFIFGIRIII
jgi:hypothetical protein